jgi:hypothetical protein
MTQKTEGSQEQTPKKSGEGVSEILLEKERERAVRAEERLKSGKMLPSNGNVLIRNISKSTERITATPKTRR